MFLIIFFYIEANLDKTYNNEEAFGTIYDTQIENKSNKEYVDIWKTLKAQKIETKTEREILI